ncbi:unnamed protein product [Spirodela intermedia]|uniref:Dof-type domain-containing protein n=1 Tax=Spirodela intermedia TaxID=51605 RepID=A0A7I8IA89_SPIIN|nr:unnamed protein product [Spirodela intermedia]CAA6654510.1 unnamed protein product [Spirodela intermedia]
MSEARDPAIKLFGRTIPLPESRSVENSDFYPMDEAGEEVKDSSGEISRSRSDPPSLERLQGAERVELDACSGSCSADENSDCQSTKQGDRSASDPKTKQLKNEPDGSNQQKVLKKPDKLLPCPRCNSLDTKFCYYNNYNVNQPRHFCKNCQRYWTAGGTMRNVPVGAGRRKNKHSASHCRHLLMPSEAAPSPQADHPNSAHNQPTAGSLMGSRTVLKFGADAPLCESMASVLHLGDQKRNPKMGSSQCDENGDEPPSSASSLVASCAVEDKFPDNSDHMDQGGVQSCSNEPTPLPHPECFPGQPWAYPWTPGWTGFALPAGQHPSKPLQEHDNGNGNPVSWNSHMMMASPAFCGPAIRLPFVPASFWGYKPNWPNETWSMPWIGSGGVLPSPPSTGSGCSGSVSPTLGKHCRDSSLLTLRIDDPDEAAKSSIWATLGIKPDPDESMKESGIFKGFQPNKIEGRDIHLGRKQVLHLNPAALSRSQTFQEST